MGSNTNTGYLCGLEFFTRREEGIMADTAMRPRILERKQESHSEG